MNIREYKAIYKESTAKKAMSVIVSENDILR